MKYIFNIDFIKGNELLFWIYLISMLLIIVLAIIFVKKEIKNEYK